MLSVERSISCCLTARLLLLIATANATTSALWAPGGS